MSKWCKAAAKQVLEGVEPGGFGRIEGEYADLVPAVALAGPPKDLVARVRVGAAVMDAVPGKFGLLPGGGRAGRGRVRFPIRSGSALRDGHGFS